MLETVSLESLAFMDGNGVDDMNPKPDEGESAPAVPAPASAATGDGISIFDAVVACALLFSVAACSSGVVVVGCMKLKLDAAGISSGAAAAAISVVLSSLEGDPVKKEKALEGAAVSGAAVLTTGGAVTASWLGLSCDLVGPPTFKKENPDEGGSATAGAGVGVGAGSGVDMYDMKEKALLAGAGASAAAPASDVAGSSFFLSGVALTSKPPNILLLVPYLFRFWSQSNTVIFRSMTVE
jgi:hypothetical protein